MSTCPFQSSRGRASYRGRNQLRFRRARPVPPLGSIINTVTNDELREDAGKYRHNSSITDCSFVTSYNWLGKNERPPTILVPGKPPRWTPLTEPTKLKEDSGEYFRDINAARCPVHPMEPAMLALLTECPESRSDLDIVACNSTVGNLSRFIRGVDKPFRMLIENIDGTVFFIRRENSPTEVMAGLRGYGHTFPEAYTTWDHDVRGSESHQRLIRYRFGGRNMLVRFQGDGYMAKKKIQKPLESRSTAEEPLSLDDLLLSWTDDPCVVEHIESQLGPEVRIKKAGEKVDQSLMFDLKTRSIKGKDNDILGAELPRLWIQQIQTLIIAFHKDGMFDDIDIHDVQKDIQEWEMKHTEELACLNVLIGILISTVQGRQDNKIEVVYPGQGKLEIREQLPDAAGALSAETRAMWRSHDVARIKTEILDED